MTTEGRTLGHPHDVGRDTGNAIGVQIHYHGRHFYAARGRRLSRQGMYLDVRNLTLPVGTEVELELEYLGHSRRIEALVIHRSPTRVGVRFIEEQPDLDSGIEAADSDSTEADSLMPPLRLAGVAAIAGTVLTSAHD
jgi:hypothetical protein